MSNYVLVTQRKIRISTVVLSMNFLLGPAFVFINLSSLLCLSSCHFPPFKTRKPTIYACITMFFCHFTGLINYDYGQNGALFQNWFSSYVMYCNSPFSKLCASTNVSSWSCVCVCATTNRQRMRTKTMYHMLGKGLGRAWG